MDTPMNDNRQGEWEIQVFFDGDCPVCRREVAFLRTLHRGRRILYTDIAAAEFDPAHWGKARSEFMDRIHARLPDGSWLEGVEVFRRLYAAAGFGALVAPTRLPGVSHALEWAYRVFARNRMRWTGRCDETCGPRGTAEA
jgi:predicted DCC family thiol-disulfide oxidoreductase YuxK